MQSTSEKTFKLNTLFIVSIAKVFIFLLSLGILIIGIYEMAHQRVVLVDDNYFAMLLFAALLFISGISLITPKQIILNMDTLYIRNFPHSKKIAWEDVEIIMFQASDWTALWKRTWRGYYGTENLLEIHASTGIYYANLKEKKDYSKIVETLDALGIEHKEK